mmetsp:Transcript_17300/g.32572  ORF Transcript_17300/g.32572 Transcript_17300/m.32572 type:complete len:259 (-) Transcript_17300:504-1280(-)
MFRESDYVPPRMHQSYKDRKVPEMQQRSQASEFDDVPDRRPTYKSHEADIVVPTTHDTQYDPHNPDADWSGLVSKDRMQRRHANDHRSQGIGIVHQEDGIVTKPGCEAEFKHRTTAKQQSTSSLIGGISAADDQYKTTAHRQQNQEGISRDQLVLKKRIGSKKALDSQFEPSPHPQVQNQNISNYQQHRQQMEPSREQYRFSATGVGGKNFTANIGASLVSRVPDKPTARHVDPNDLTKTMLSQNHNPHPGYTGKRPF